GLGGRALPPVGHHRAAVVVGRWRSVPVMGPRNARLRCCCTPTRDDLRPFVVRVSCGGRCRHGMESAGPRAVAPYVSRAAADTILHAVVQEHLETLLAAAAAHTDRIGLPRFIER